MVRDGAAVSGQDAPGPPAVAPRVRETVDRAVATLPSPGTWLTGEQRVAVANRARRSIDAGDGDPADPADDPLLAAAHRVAAAPSSITAGWIDGLESEGLHRLAYVEVVGVVARTCAIDTFQWALDQPRPPLGDPLDGQPSRVVVDGARQTSAWVPIAGPANAVTALSAVAEEARARSQLSEALYLDDERVHLAATGGGARDGLTRPQMELLAARVSHHNDCFY